PGRPRRPRPRLIRSFPRRHGNVTRMRYPRRSLSGRPGAGRMGGRIMAYDIDVSSVTAVLLADGWHKVKGRSFGIEPYGYVLAAPEAKAGDAEGKKPGNGNGKKRAAATTAVAEKGLTPSLGARWTKPNGEVIACPVASVLALRQTRRVAKA